jgi:hypothetical protein
MVFFFVFFSFDSLSINRGAQLMKSFARGLGAAAFCLGLLGALGCSEDNEATLREQASKTSGADIPEPTVLTDQRQMPKSLPQSSAPSKPGPKKQKEKEKEAATAP